LKNLEQTRKLQGLNVKSNLNFTDSRERNKLKNGKLNKNKPDSILKREWRWKELSESREPSKSDKSRKLQELSTRKSLS